MSSNQGYIAWLESQFNGSSSQTNNQSANNQSFAPPFTNPTSGFYPPYPSYYSPYPYPPIDPRIQQLQLEALIAQQQANYAFYQSQIETAQRQQTLASVAHDPESYNRVIRYYKNQDDSFRNGLLSGFG